jgi:hypothetical protein
MFDMNQCFFKIFYLLPKKQSSWERFSQIWLLTRYEIQNFNHPSTSLASHSKPNFVFWASFTMFFPSLLAIENLQNLLFSIFPKTFISFFGEISPTKKRQV